MTNKPGVKTSEFWISLLASLAGPVVAILMAADVFRPDTDVDQLVRSFQVLAEHVVVIIGLITGSLSAKSYTQARSQLKASEIERVKKDEPKPESR